MGFRDLEAFNDALLAKQVWRLLNEPSSLLACLLQAKYYPGGDILTARLGHRPNFTWRGLWAVRTIIEKGSRRVIGDGLSIDIWHAGFLVNILLRSSHRSPRTSPLPK